MNALKKIYFHLKERYIYNKYVKRTNLSFGEYRNGIKEKTNSKYNWVSTVLYGKSIKKADNIGYVHSILEIFIDKVYLFQTDKKNPYIIDCGANIGLSIIYFKRLYPKAKIIAFEPDPELYDLCCYNIQQFDLKDVEVKNLALWIKEEEMSFKPDNSLGGMLSNDVNDVLKIRAVRLLPFLDREVDFLKIDIEGAEVDVLIDCRNSLNKVHNLFVEYHSYLHETQRLNVLLNILTDAGFRYYIEEATGLLTHPFIDQYKVKANNFDLQLNIFAYR